MAVNKSSSARELGAQLRELRNGAGLTVRQLAEAVGVSGANVSFWENGQRLIPMERLTSILDALSVHGDDRERLVALRRQADGPGELAAGAPNIGPQLAQLIDHEQAASRIINWQLTNMPGLLQTTDWARAVLPDGPDQHVKVALRAGRRDILTRRDNPVDLVALIDSEALVRPIAPPSVMARQFEHLLEMGQRPNVTIQIVPSTTPGMHPGLDGSFVVIEFPSAAPIVHVEHYRASAFLWDEKDVADYLRAAEEIQERAMTPDRTSEVIEEMLKGLRT